MTTAFLFPGQGSQSVGMGKELAAASPAAKALFQEVDDALGQALSRLMFEGPEDALTLTANAQPAIMAHSLAVLRVMEQEAGLRLADKAAFVAGHSLGEYSALAAAGSLAVPDTARLLRVRGDAMQAAVAPGEGAMAAILGLDRDAVDGIAAAASTDGEICAAANDNAPGQVVISGHTAAVDRAIALAKAAGARRAMALAVSAPFHCTLMAPAADAMREALAGTAMQAPLVPVIANVTAAPVADVAELKRLLVEQVTGLVRWRDSIEALHLLGVHRFVEIGGRILAPIVKRIVPDAETISIVSMQTVEQAVRDL
jgi:[acyl-carrier-protein] S-malonyltransferase